MTVRRYSSISQETTLVSALNTTATTMVVNSAAVLGSITPGTGERFTLVIDPDTALEEIVYAVSPTSPSSTTITIIRGVDGTGTEGVSGIAHSAGAKVRHMAIGVDFREANNHINNSTTAHGLTIANVLETTDTNIITTDMLQANAVTTAKITDLNVTTGKIADSAITSAKIADGTIVAGDIADGAVTSAKILDGTIVNADINSSAGIDKTKISGTAVTVADTGTVTSTMIADGTITNTDINASAGIAYSKLSLTGSITSSDITDATIVNADISNTAAIALSKLAVDPLARANHTGTQAASTISDFDTQVRTNRLDQMAAPTGAVSANSQKVTNLATPTSSTDASTKGYVDTQITNLIGTAPSTLDTLQEIATAINNDAGLFTTLNNGKLNRDGTQAMTGALAMGTNKITGLGDPTNAQDGATKNYVDTGASSQVAAAAASATAAAASATAASGSATSASSSATSATASASSATSSASSATSSASAAATSATNAGNSATAASNSASTASTQATNAATSASAASTSASNASSSASAASTSATNAAASYDSFDDRYLGAKSSAPSVDNDGNALITGALYWNTAVNKMFVWSGTAWTEISSSAEIIAYKYTVAGGATSVSGADDNSLTLSYTVGKEQVYINGVLQVRGSDYTASTGSSITGMLALTANDIVTVLAFTAFSVSNTYTQAEANARFVQNTGDFSAGKNKIINGDFNIWQRGTSFTYTGANYTADRFQGYSDGSQTYSRQTFTPGTAPVAGYEGKYFWRAAKAATGTFVSLIQYIEDVQTFAGQNMTVSFWAKADSNQTVYIRPAQTFAGGSATVVLSPVTVNITTSWSRVSATFAVPSIAGKTIGATGSTIYIENFIVTNGAVNFDVWGFQAEAGSVATAFQTATGTLQGELAACQRYYYRTTSTAASARLGLGQCRSTTEAIIQTIFPVSMRIAPTALEQTGTASNYLLQDASGSGANCNTVPAFNDATIWSAFTSMTRASGLVAGNITTSTVSAANIYLGWSAEL